MDRYKNTIAYNVHFKLPRHLVEREAFLLAHCAGKRVLHVGCADYVSRGNWIEAVCSDSSLHRKIERVANEVIGIDSAADAVEVLRSRYNMTNIYAADAQRLDTLVSYK